MSILKMQKDLENNLLYLQKLMAISKRLEIEVERRQNKNHDLSNLRNKILMFQMDLLYDFTLLEENIALLKQYNYVDAHHYPTSQTFIDLKLKPFTMTPLPDLSLPPAARFNNPSFTLTKPEIPKTLEEIQTKMQEAFLLMNLYLQCNEKLITKVNTLDADNKILNKEVNQFLGDVDNEIKSRTLLEQEYKQRLQGYEAHKRSPTKHLNLNLFEQQNHSPQTSPLEIHTQDKLQQGQHRQTI